MPARCARPAHRTAGLRKNETKSKKSRETTSNEADLERPRFDYTGREEIPGSVVRVRVLHVDCVPAWTFRDCRRLRSVQLHEGLRSIETEAFHWCSSLESIHVPSSVTVIGDRAFYRCFNLKSLELSEGLREIGECAFSECKSLESIQVPPSVAVIGDGAFTNCTNLKSVELPVGLREIGPRAFSSCHSLEHIQVPSSVTKIGAIAFSRCTSLRSVQLPEGLQTVGKFAFSFCQSLESVRLPSSLTELGPGSLDQCRNLTFVHLPEGLETVAPGVFKGCPWLRSFRFSCLTSRMEAISFDRRTKVEIENKIAQISDSAKRGGESWAAARESLEQLRGLITYWELKEATVMLELALWKVKIEAEGDAGELNKRKSKAKQQKEGRTQEREQDNGAENGQGENNKGTTRLSRKDCRVKCGADIVTREVSSFFTYNRGWW